MTRPAARGEEPHRLVEPLVEPVGDGLDRRGLEPEHPPAELDQSRPGQPSRLAGSVK